MDRVKDNLFHCMRRLATTVCVITCRHEGITATTETSPRVGAGDAVALGLVESSWVIEWSDNRRASTIAATPLQRW